MAERDAFGNEIGAGSSPIPGSSPGGVPSWTPPPTTPSPIPDSTESAATATGLSAAPSYAPAPMRPGSSGLPAVSMSNASAKRSVGGGGRRGMTTFISVVVAIAIIGIPAYLALRTAKKATSSITSSLPFNAPTPSTSGSPTPAKPSTPGAAPTGIAAGSLARPAALAKFVKDLHGQGTLVQLRVSPENLQAQTMTPSRAIRSIYIDYKGTSTRNTTSSGGFGQQPAIPLSQIDAFGPTRMLHHISRSTKGINYLVLDHDFNGKLQWLAYYKNSQHFYSADVHGRHAHQVG